MANRSLAVVLIWICSSFVVKVFGQSCFSLVGFNTYYSSDFPVDSEVTEGNYKYYHFSHPTSGETEFTVTLTPYDGDPDLCGSWASFSTTPTLEIDKHQVSSENGAGRIDSFVVNITTSSSPLQPMCYIIGVYGFSTSTFTLDVTSTTTTTSPTTSDPFPTYTPSPTFAPITTIAPVPSLTLSPAFTYTLAPPTSSPTPVETNTWDSGSSSQEEQNQYIPKFVFFCGLVVNFIWIVSLIASLVFLVV